MKCPARKHGSGTWYCTADKVYFFKVLQCDAGRGLNTTLPNDYHRRKRCWLENAHASLKVSCSATSQLFCVASRSRLRTGAFRSHGARHRHWHPSPPPGQTHALVMFSSATAACTLPPSAVGGSVPRLREVTLSKRSDAGERVSSESATYSARSIRKAPWRAQSLAYSE